ncbi:MAG: hypothetical protein R3F19_19745 [Verrucomicrobiales bacterium]|nr:hypothetical protein [Verrucomicrobiae bacterium]
MARPLLLTFTFFSFLLFVSTYVRADESQESSFSETQLERLHKRNKRNAETAWAKDEKKMSKKEFAEMERDYQQINKNYKASDIKEVIGNFLKKYKEGNRVGCATLYLAQKSSGDAREALLKTAIENFSDSYYLDGCNVGGLARLYLASYYKQTGKNSDAERLIAEIKKDYKDAQDHSGKPILDAAQALAKQQP